MATIWQTLFLAPSPVRDGCGHAWRVFQFARRPDQAALPNTSSSLNRQNSANGTFNSSALLQDAHRRPTFSVSTGSNAAAPSFRHLSFARWRRRRFMRGCRRRGRSRTALQVAQLALLSTLNALLTHEPKPPTIIRHTHLGGCQRWHGTRPVCGWRRYRHSRRACRSSDSALRAQKPNNNKLTVFGRHDRDIKHHVSEIINQSFWQP
ncbi:hypothetical protein J4732_16550 [Serratia marcescens]|uniref:Uncharacterized protein n=1 Tax=Serratia marcescens TaxID=615 RepID=A0A939NQ82_SERMA|nr:hypothetical protein [Serratia marcescens]